MTIQISVYDPVINYPEQKRFNCENETINAFVRSSLKAQVKKNLSVAYVLTDSESDDRFVGFYTIAQHMIDVSALSAIKLGSLPKKIPCSRLIMLGIDREYQGQRLGSKLMKHALELTRMVARQIGSYGLYLDAESTAIDFYKKLGFQLLSDDRHPNPSPMFLPIGSIG